MKIINVKQVPEENIDWTITIILVISSILATALIVSMLGRKY